MKKLNFVFYLFLIVSNINAQKWQQTIGLPNRGENTHDVIELYDKGIFIPANYFEGKSGGWSVKSDINGYEIYNKTITHSLNSVEFLSSVADKNGNIYLCGIIVLDDVWPIIARYDSCGNNVWCRVFVNDNFWDGVAKDLIITNGGDILVLVNHDSNEQIDQIHLYCLNDDGNIIWIKPYASKNEHPLIAVARGYNLYHYNNSYFIDGYCYYPYPGNPIHVFQRPLFIKIDSLFNEKWILPFGISDSIVGKAWSTINVSDSLYMGACMLRLNAINEHSLIAYFNDNGDELGHYEIPNDSIGINVSQNYIVDIEKINNVLFLASIPVGYNNEWYEYGDFIIDSTGNIYNKQIWPNTNGYSDLIKTSDGNFVVAVETDEGNGNNDILLYKIDENLQSVPFDTNTYVYDSLCPGGIQSGTIDITDCFIWTNIEDVPLPQEYYASLKTIPIKAYPNPATRGSITFEFENTEHHKNIELRCFDIYGTEVYKERVYRCQGKSIVDVSLWKNGMYIAVVYSDGLPAGQFKFVVQ